MDEENVELWRELKSIAANALEKPEQEREHWVREACRGDAAKLAAVLRLLGFSKVLDESPPCSAEAEPSKSPADVPDLAQTECLSFPRPRSDWSDPGIYTGSERHAELQPGIVLGHRYEIVRSLGQGGMGAVYLADDREVGRPVALKVIRSELVGDPDILRRFRKELVLARGVTHPNVVRIFDLGLMNGVRFISMEYVEGRQLSSILEERGQLPAKEAAEIVLQVGRGLAATHSQGVVHRDLKPSNIMVAKKGRAVVMDFGIARGETGRSADTRLRAEASNSLTSITHVGDLLGTPMYMSPEQARGEGVDRRSDLFTLGLIFYEMLTGTVPLLGKSAHETLKKRCEETPIPPSVLEPQIPKAVNQIVLKCVQTSPRDRYQSADDLVHDLESYLGIGQPRTRGWTSLVAGGVATSLIIISGFFVYQKQAANTTITHTPVRILIADLDNQTPEPVFSGALEPVISFAMEETPFITSYERNRAHNVAAELKPGMTRLDATMARLVAIREGINVVISGAVSRVDGRYRVSVEAHDSAQGTAIASSEITTAHREEVLQRIQKLVAPIRKALGDQTPRSVKSAAQETFSAASLEAAQKYAQAQGAQQKGNWQDALRLYAETVKLDPGSGRAYAGMASTLTNLGRHQEAQKYYELALTKLDRMSERERYRTRGAYFLFMGKALQAMEQNKALVDAFPADTAGLTNLAYAYFLQRDMATAKRLNRQAADIYPGNILLRSNAGLFAMYAGDFDEAINESRNILNINPQFNKALLCIALAQLGQGKIEDARMTWQRLATMGADGASSASLGLADLALYEGRFDDIIKMLPTAIDADIADKNVSVVTLKRIALAQAYLAAGETSNALLSAEAALRDRADEPIAFPAANIFLEAGREQRAMALASMMKSSLDPQPRAYSRVIDGLILLKHKDYRAALAALQEAQKLSDTWFGRLALARAYLEAGAFAEADSELDNCIRRLGETTAIFFDDEPSLRYLPPAYYYRGRAREGLHIPSAGDDYRAFLQLKTHSLPDPLVADAKRRITR
jgi:serine/threonine protein kinase/tetratricopeptide (TPR) repeat protein